MESKNDIKISPSLEVGKAKDFTVIKNERNVIKALNNEIVEKDILVKEKKPRAYAINLPQPNKLLVFIVANTKKASAVLWTKEIIK